MPGRNRAGPGSPEPGAFPLRATSFAFSLGLGAATVALPLVALAHDYSSWAIGVLTASAAVAQLVARARMGAALSRWPDRTMVLAATMLLVASSVVVAVSAAVVPFVVAELLQGAARGCYWTGSQTHAVRRSEPVVRSLSALNLWSSCGLLIGPVVAGLLIDVAVPLPLWAAALAGAVAAGLATRLQRHPPFRPPPRASDQRIWRQPAVAAAGWMGASAGTWRGLMGSYVPVVLTQAAQSSAAVGVLVSLANGSSLVGAWLTGRGALRTRWLVGSTVLAGLGLTVASVVAAWFVPVAVALAVSGVGAGALQTYGPAVAAGGVHPEERGLAIASSGTYRTVALLVAPAAVAGLVLVLPVSVALAAAGALAAVPALGARRATTSAVPH